MQKFKTCLHLFLVMLKIGLFTFGGGYAMISLLESELITKRGWMENGEFLNMVAIAESTPGPVAINAATYVGYKRAGVWGALTATVAVCIPSFLIIFLISLFFDAFLSLKYVAYAFDGIQVCVIFLILNAGIRMLMQLEKTVCNIAVLIAVIACMVTLSVLSVAFSSVWYILITAGLALALYLFSYFKSGHGKGQTKATKDGADAEAAPSGGAGEINGSTGGAPNGGADETDRADKTGGAPNGGEAGK